MDVSGMIALFHTYQIHLAVVLLVLGFLYVRRSESEESEHGIWAGYLAMAFGLFDIGLPYLLKAMKATQGTDQIYLVLILLNIAALGLTLWGILLTVYDFFQPPTRSRGRV